MDDGNIIDTKIPIEAFDELKIGIQGVIDPTKSYADNLLSVNSYIRDFARIIESDAGKNLSSMTEGLKTGEISIEDYNSALRLLREEFGDNSAIVAAIEFFASFTDTMRNAGDQTEETAKQISGLSVVLKGISTSRSILEKARDDMEQYGSLQRDTIQSLYDSLGKNEDINKYLTITGDVITLNETDWLERQRGIYQSEIDAYESANKKYIKRRDELISQIDAANAYINKTDGYDTSLYVDSNEASSALIQYQDDLSSVNAKIERNNVTAQ